MTRSVVTWLVTRDTRHVLQTFWRSELQSELERNVNETHHLETTRKNLERALAETEGPMRVNAECIYNRSGLDSVKHRLHVCCSGRGGKVLIW